MQPDSDVVDTCKKSNWRFMLKNSNLIKSTSKAIIKKYIAPKDTVRCHKLLKG
jgi:hypothetical protein